MVFDDLLLEKQNTCESYYVRGRHSNVDCFYLAKLFQAPTLNNPRKREFSLSGSQDLKNLNQIFEAHVASDKTKEEFKNYAMQLEKKNTGL